MKRSLLTVFFFSTSLFQAIGYAANNPVYTCRWYFIRQCGTGHAGGVEFIQEDDSGNIRVGTEAGPACFAPVKRRQTARKGIKPATAADGEEAGAE